MSETPRVGVLMFIASRAIETRVIAAVRDAGFTGITLAQARLAARIAESGSRLSDLAEQGQVTKQTATHLVDQLEKAGLVERAVDPSDARARLVRFTAKGKEIVTIAEATEATIYAEWTERLGPGRMTQLHEILTELRPLTDPFM
ncbi:MarR family winged helix-turn-helix transcriptional regulator [Smaragdicoccus niigatensis]|uniref:MarR family winged helix-turn-helix transcriptional regulator n=1 Tax=Smaragdicoccus niigatensis TaxID=359359 RepID=UPI000375C689|nr:MarR family transcriptional regulator [Smaragdicoccus niigatensis]